MLFNLTKIRDAKALDFSANESFHSFSLSLFINNIILIYIYIFLVCFCYNLLCSLVSLSLTDVQTGALTLSALKHTLRTKQEMD